MTIGKTSFHLSNISLLQWFTKTINVLTSGKYASNTEKNGFYRFKNVLPLLRKLLPLLKEHVLASRKSASTSKEIVFTGENIYFHER